MSLLLLAAEKKPGFQEVHPIGPESFEFKSFTDFTLFGLHVAVTRMVTMAFFAAIVISLFFLIALRKPKMVPGRLQFSAEAIYGFVRDQVAKDVIGPEGIRFASYLTSLFVFILVLNLYEILPLAQTPVTGRIAYPAVLAIATWILFIAVGIKKQGFGAYFKGALLPPGVPKGLYVLLTPIEFVSTFIFRPFTLAVRLFANMFAGHLLVLIFFSGALYMWSVGGLQIAFGTVAFLIGIVVTFFELLIISLQAYIFVTLTAVYVAESLAEEH
ncbi:MAG TPA: F0F1 ATP synthase subunit A [Frankiaceae bacterium]|nr:F0F1 ATP synthase subunit A [Frankiaceae bacterium]